MSDKVIIVGTIGKPGMEVSATFSPLNMDKVTDVGKVVQDELDELNPVQKGYREDMVKYKKQTERYNNDKSS